MHVLASKKKVLRKLLPDDKPFTHTKSYIWMNWTSKGLLHIFYVCIFHSVSHLYNKSMCIGIRNEKLCCEIFLSSIK